MGKGGGVSTRRGFSLITTAVLLVIVVGMLGLTVDVGRMYVVKTELQAYADAAAIAAAYELDGINYGIKAANWAATAGPAATGNRWNFDTQAVPSVQVQFSQSSNSGWMDYAAAYGAPAGVKFVRVAVNAPSPMLLLNAAGVAGNFTTINAVAVAGHRQESGCRGQCDPFSPDAPVPGDKVTFGFDKGDLYGIKWAPKGQQKNAKAGICPGDEEKGYTAPQGSDRGYIDMGQGRGNDALQEAILGRYYRSPLREYRIDDPIDVVTGNKSPVDEIFERLDQDTDTTSATYAQYMANRDPATGRIRGNGRRFLYVPINVNGIIKAFATFFMQTAPEAICDNKNSGNCCAEFVSLSAVAGGHAGPLDASGSMYRVKLFSGE